MAYIPRSSFIPKEASGAIPMQVRKRRTVRVFSLISTLLLLGSLASAGGTYFYRDLAKKQLATAKEELSATSQEGNDSKIEEVRTYDRKLKIADNLLKNHLAMSRLFAEIEGTTKETVQFKSLGFEYDPGFEATLTLAGNTEEFSSVALQKMQFLKDTLFSEFIVQGISTSADTETPDPKKPKTEKSTASTDGKVGFSVTGIFKKGLLEYAGISESTTSTSSDATVEMSTETASTSTSSNITPQL